MFELRCHAAAEPHFQKIAGMMREAYDMNCPVSLKAGEWHLPLFKAELDSDLSVEDRLKVCTARCARVSYLTHEGDRDVAKDIELHDQLSTNKHWSPFEHVAQALKYSHQVGNLVGFMQYRKTFETEYAQSPQEESTPG